MDRQKPDEERISRREFLRRVGCLGLAVLLPGSLGYSFVEPHWLRVDRCRVKIPGLPPAFTNLRIVQLTDLHHGPWIDLDHINTAIGMALDLAPDLILVTGDNVHRSPKYIEPVYQALSVLEAPLGVFGVLGNHDQWEDEDLVKTRRLMRRAGIVELTNARAWLQRQGQYLCLAGVGDLWTDQQHLDRALSGVPQGATVILMSHNPDYNEQMNDPRVKLMVAGHTHGGQVVLPLLGPLVLPSKYGHKYAGGLVRDGSKQVYVSRGVGMAVLPVRFGCRPEVSLLTLVPA